MGGKKKGWAASFTSLFVETDGDGGGGSDPAGDVDIEALLRETSSMTAGVDVPDDTPAPAAPAAPVATPAAAAPMPGLEIGQPLAQLYQAYNVPASPKAIEEIMLFLEGLKTMPQNVQITALKAMDDADPSWSIVDVIVDGRNKAAALSQAKGAVDLQVQNARAEVATEVAAQDAYLQEAKATIKEQVESLHAQIKELTELQAAEENQVMERKAAAHGRITSLEQQALKEHQRIETEIARITQIVNAFGPMAQEA